MDLTTLRSALAQLRRGELLIVAQRAAEMVPAAALPLLLGGLVELQTGSESKPVTVTLLEEVQRFHAEGMRGQFYEPFNVNSRNCSEQSRGTDAFIAEFDRLVARCIVEAHAEPGHATAKAFEVLFSLLRYIDEGNDDVLFFADVGTHAHAVLCHALKRDRPNRRQRGHVVAEHFVQRLVVADAPAAAEVVQRVVVDRHATADPAVGVVLAAQPRDFATAAHAVEHGVQPQREQNARVDRPASGGRAACLDGIEQCAQVLTFDVAPHEPRAVLFGQQRFEIRGAQLDLRAVGLEHARRALAALARRMRLRIMQLRKAWLGQVLEQAHIRRLALAVSWCRHAKYQASRVPVRSVGEKLSLSQSGVATITGDAPRCMPESSRTSSPVTVRAASSSQITASATSSAVHARFSGVERSYAALSFS